MQQELKTRFLDKTYKHYLNKSTILFGASGSGKSTILIDILFQIKDHVPIIFVFSPTSDTNNAFDGIVPAPLVYQNVDIEILTSIYNRQQAATKIYNTVNNIQTLRAIFITVASPGELKSETVALSNASKLINKQQNSTIGIAEKKQAVADISNLRDKYLIKLYKNTIRNNKELAKHKVPGTATQYVLKYLDFNPNCVVVLDDCGAVLKRFQKEEVVKKIIFQGRHSHINIILTLQDDLNLDSSIKKNAFVNIFTTARCATAYFERGSNSFSKKDKELAARIITNTFTASSDFKKLAYIRDDIDPFRYIVADIHENFQFGAPSIWTLCNKISKNNNICDFKNDPTLSAFKIS